MADDYPPVGDGATTPYTWQPPPPRPKFQHRYRWHVVLLLATFVTTSLVGGFWYSIPVLIILGAHEFGHYVFCRIHNVDATLPYFLPAPPIFISGTFGAVIRIRDPFPSTRALFDIGIAGPIAGFVALVPFLIFGIAHSQVLPVNQGWLHLGDPLLTKFLVRMYFGHIRDGYDVFIHPTALAAWWGMLATALNLMPFGQLDGGHIVYSLIGRRAAVVSAATLGVAVLLTLLSTSWIAMAVMMIVMALVLGIHHPRVFDESTPLDPTRRLVALLALVMFALCFTPVPIQIIFGR